MKRLSPRVLTTIGAAAALAASLLVANAPTAGAAVIIVSPGQSIQTAVNSAPPGSTIHVQAGNYHESVEITNQHANNLTIEGSGPGSTFLGPPPSPPTGESPICFDPSAPSVSGFCVHGQFDHNFNLVTPVSHVRITGFTIQNFSGNGIIFFGATDAKTDHIVATDNHDYGVAAFVTTGETHQHEIISGSNVAGLYLGDSPNANATVSDITAQNNAIGFFVRDASTGTLWQSSAHGNCAGFVFVDGGGGIAHWDVSSSSSTKNNKACLAGPDLPALSGIGMGLLGIDSSTFHGNTVNDNVPSGQTLASGGILLQSSKSGAPDHDAISNNSAHGNHPFDLFWDGTGIGNTFSGNSCGTSQPSGLCV